MIFVLVFTARADGLIGARVWPSYSALVDFGERVFQREGDVTREEC